MTERQMIEFIYSKVADKTLSFGCIWKDMDWDYVYYHSANIWISKDNPIKYLDWSIYPIKIIWHPVFIWDILSYFNTIWITAVVWTTGKIIWNKNKEWSCFEIEFNLTEPIEKQLLDSITKIYNLIKENE